VLIAMMFIFPECEYEYETKLSNMMPSFVVLSIMALGVVKLNIILLGIMMPSIMILSIFALSTDCCGLQI
jgi:hypothetical protein